MINSSLFDPRVCVRVKFYPPPHTHTTDDDERGTTTTSQNNLNSARESNSLYNNMIKSKRINANSHMESNNEIWNICTKFW